MAAETEALTDRVRAYYDLLESLKHVSHGGSRQTSVGDFKEIAHAAYRKLFGLHKWTYYYKEHRVQLSANYSTGTIAYDHTDGSSERLVTLTDGTWPTWAKYGRMVIDDIVYDVDDRLDATTLTLTENMNPGADVAAGESYEIYRSKYQLPADMWKMEEIYVEDGGWITNYVHPSTWVWQERYVQDRGRPWAWTILPDEDRIGQFNLVVEPPPETAEPIAFLYHRSPRVLRWSGNESSARISSFSGSADAATATIASLPSSMTGSLLRISSSSDYPTGLSGQNPFVEQHQIASISGSTVTLKSNLQDTYSGTKAIVTDPVDMSENMLSALDAWLEYFLAKRSRDKRADNDLAYALHESRVAAGNESRVFRTGISYYFLTKEWGMSQATIGDD